MEHGHSWSEIREYTLSQLGLFVREASKLDEVKRKERITASWLGFNADQKSIKRILESVSIKSTKQSSEEMTADEHRKNWNKLAAALRGMR